jgi:hypothetical protein
MEDPSNEASIPAENTINSRRVNGVMRRKVGKQTFPWMTAQAVDHMPPPPPPPNGRSMSVRRKYADLLEYSNPSAANPASPPPQDEAIPAAKKARLETSISTAVDVGVVVAVGLAAQATHSFATASPSTIVAVVPKDVVTVSYPLQNTEARRAPRHIWTTEEDAKLTSAVKKLGDQWVAVVALVPGRTNTQCRRRWADNVDPSIDWKTGKWTTEEDAKLTSAEKKHGKDWLAVAALVPGRTNEQCRHRWENCGVDRGPRRNWKPEEDAKLTSAVKKHGNNWVAVAALVPGRTNVKCRDRWANCLGPGIDTRVMGKWTSEEEAKLIEAVQKHGKDWVAVAALVQSRTSFQCRRIWTVRLGPAAEGTSPNEGTWTPEEDGKLTDAIRKCGKDWVAVAPLVPGRTNNQCRRRWADNVDPSIDRGPRRNWKPEEDAKLIEGVEKHGKDWVAVAALVPGRTNDKCRDRWNNSVVPGIDRTTGAWVTEEDALTSAVKKHGNNWLAVATLVSGRSKSQCRYRWGNYLDPNTNRTKGKWTAEEDTKLIDAVAKCGKAWVAVAALVPGRTNVQCWRAWTVRLAPTIEGTPTHTPFGPPYQPDTLVNG